MSLSKQSNTEKLTFHLTASPQQTVPADHKHYFQTRQTWSVFLKRMYLERPVFSSYSRYSELKQTWLFDVSGASILIFNLHIQSFFGSRLPLLLLWLQKQSRGSIAGERLLLITGVALEMPLTNI